MGLDMYMQARCYTSKKYTGPDLNAKLHAALPEQVRAAHDAAKNLGTIEVTVEIGYWRKANAIHRWFVEKVQDGKDECQTSEVSREQLVELRALCSSVLEQVETVPGKVNVGTQYSGGKVTQLTENGEVIAQPGVAERLLPTAAGFFFGSTDYDQYYLDDLRQTVAIVDRALALPDGWNIEYRASW